MSGEDILRKLDLTDDLNAVDRLVFGLCLDRNDGQSERLVNGAMHFDVKVVDFGLPDSGTLLRMWLLTWNVVASRKRESRSL
jgi:hypothetical protein